jgi:hypothetical protein
MRFMITTWLIMAIFLTFFWYGVVRAGQYVHQRGLKNIVNEVWEGK